MMNIMNPPADWSTLKKLIWLRGMPASAMGSETLSLTAFAAPTLKTVTKKSKVTSCTVSFSPSQDLHGYSNPWPAGGGKNKLNPDYSAYKTSPSYLFCDNVVPGGTAVMSFTDKDTSVNISGMYIGFCKGLTEEGESLPAYRWAIKNGVVQSNTTNVASDGDVGALCDQVFIYPKTQATFDALFARYDIQAELGSTATTYAPYSNICPISGWQGAEVTVSGKNLYSKEDSVYNVPVYAQDGTATAYADVAVWWMPAKPNTEYTVSCNPNEVTFYLRWINCDSNKGFINRDGSAYANTGLPRKFTTPANCRWVQIAVNQNDTAHIALNDWEVMVVEGSTAADYEPYRASTSSVTYGVISKNKFGPNENPTAEAYIKSNGDVATGSTATNWIISDYIPVLAETQYTFNPNSTSGAVAYFAYYDSTKTLISTIVSSTTTFTTPADCAYMRFSYRDTSTNIQLELGSSATSYEPYRDYILGGTAEIVAGTGSGEWESITLNGSETWGGSGAHSMYTQVNSLAQMTDYSHKMLCEALKPYKNQNDQEFINAEYGITGYGFGDYTNQNWIYIAAAGINNITDLKAWLAQNPVKVSFVKATPTPYTFPPASDQLLLQKGDNYNWAEMTND